MIMRLTFTASQRNFLNVVGLDVHPRKPFSERAHIPTAFSKIACRHAGHVPLVSFIKWESRLKSKNLRWCKVFI